MLRRAVLTMTCSILLAIPIPLAASGGAPGLRAEPALPMKIDLQVGGEKYAFTGPGVCQSSGDASIYELAATMYAVRQNGDGQSLTLTLWRPKTGAPDMLTLGVSQGARSYRVSTVKVGRQGDVRGSGGATFAKTGEGGTFTLDATAEGGTRITGTIRCERFAGIVAEGG